MLILSLSIILIITLNVNAKVISVPDDYSTIQDAINAAKDGDTIYVKGIYREGVVINKPIKLVGINATIIGESDSYCIHILKTNNVTVEGFKVKNGRYGIWVEYSKNCVVENNIAENNNAPPIVGDVETCGFGIGLTNSDNIKVVNNRIVNNSAYGLFLSNAKNNTIIGNEFLTNRDYHIAAFAESSYNLIKNNVFKRVRILHGIYLIGDSSHNIIVNNKFEDNNHDGIYTKTNYNKIINNTILGSYRGVCLEGITTKGNVIENNTVERNYYGIYLSGEENQILNNSIINNRYGLYVYYAVKSKICNNVFNNVKNVLVRYSKDNLWLKNTWSDYEGKDANNDGIGDEPYKVSPLEFDKKPLIGYRSPNFKILDNATVNVQIDPPMVVFSTKFKVFSKSKIMYALLRANFEGRVLRGIVQKVHSEFKGYWPETYEYSEWVGKIREIHFGKIQGNYSIYVEVKDFDGRTDTLKIKDGVIAEDKTPPLITNTTVYPLIAAVGEKIAIEAKVTDQSGVKSVKAVIYNDDKKTESVMYKNNGIYRTIWRSFAPGIYTIKVVAEDVYGHKSSKIVGNVQIEGYSRTYKNVNLDKYLDLIKSRKPEKISVIISGDRKSLEIAKQLGYVEATFNSINSIAIQIKPDKLAVLKKLNLNVYEDVPIQIQLDSATKTIKAPYAWSHNYTGKNVTIAIIDTGIDANHSSLDDLDDNPATNDPKVIAFKDFVNGKETPYDDNGHGTHCASIAAGTGNGTPYVGVAPGAKLVGIKVLDSRGYGKLSDLISAVQWAIDNKDKYNIRIISMSLGASINGDDSSPLEKICDAAVDAGIVVVTAAGNFGPWYDTVVIPATAKKVISVGAVNDEGRIAFFSSRGNTLDGRLKPELVAVGVDVTAAKANSKNGYITYSGTSMASPEVAGAAAILLEANSSLTPKEIKNILEDTAIDEGVSGPDPIYGYGLLDIESALNKVLGIEKKQEETINVSVFVDNYVKIEAKLSNPCVSYLIAHIQQPDEHDVANVILFDRNKDGTFDGTWIPKNNGTYYVDITMVCNLKNVEFENAAIFKI